MPDHKPSILVSACLAGCSTNLCGSANAHPIVQQWLKDGRAVAVCPEQLGGLPTPRPPAEIQWASGEEVLLGCAVVQRRDGTRVTGEFLRGAERTVQIAKTLQPDLIVLKERSPSCGVHMIYDGSFKNCRVEESCGVTTAALRLAGFNVLSELDISESS